MDIQTIAHRLEDPLHYVCEEAVRNIGNRRIGILVGYVMGHLPGDLPKWAVSDYRVGIHRKVTATVKRLKGELGAMGGSAAAATGPMGKPRCAGRSDGHG